MKNAQQSEYEANPEYRLSADDIEALNLGYLGFPMGPSKDIRRTVEDIVAKALKKRQGEVEQAIVNACSAVPKTGNGNYDIGWAYAFDAALEGVRNYDRII